MAQKKSKVKQKIMQKFSKTSDNGDAIDDQVSDVESPYEENAYDQDNSFDEEETSDDEDYSNHNVDINVGGSGDKNGSNRDLEKDLSESKVVFGKKLKKKEAVTILLSNIPLGMNDAGVVAFLKSKGIELHGCRAKYELQKIFIDVKVKDCERALALDEQTWAGHELSVEIDELEKERKQKRKELKTHRSKKDNRTLCVKNLPFSAVEQQIEMLFRGVEEVRILTDYDTATRGIAFVQFDTKEDMEKALAMKNSFKLEGRKLRLDPCGKQSKLRQREQNADTGATKRGKFWGHRFERGSGRGRAFEMERMKAMWSSNGKSFGKGFGRGRTTNRGRSRGGGRYGFGKGSATSQGRGRMRNAQ